MRNDATRRALRTFVQAFLGFLLPGLLGWLNDLTQWAADEGQRPLPDATDLAYLGIAAIAGGFVALIAFVQNAIEDATGKSVLK